MKIIINKNTPKDICIYTKDILNGLIKKLNSTSDKESRQKIFASLLALSTFISGGAIMAAKKADEINNEQNIPQIIELPIEDIEIEQTNPTPFIVEREVSPTYAEPEYTTESRNNIGIPEDVDSAIKLYTDIFEVRKGLIEPIIYDKIYNNPNFYNDFTLDGTTYPNMHEAIFFTVLDVVYHPGKYGYNNDELRSYIDWETDLTAEEMTSIFSDYFGINPLIPQVIEYAECGTKMNSIDYLEKNNPAGIGPHNTFRNKATGIIYLCYKLKKDYGINEQSGPEDLERISVIYCTDGTEIWIKNTKEFYTILAENGFLYMRRNDNIDFCIDNFTYDEYINKNNKKMD